jgi:superoxide dismutase, Fe-Mn family
MNARTLDLPFNAAALKGLSEKLLTSHHQNNYGGAVKRLNAIRTSLRDVPMTTAPGFQINGLKREELIATNSMLLHELYFDSLGGDGTPMAPPMALALQGNFQSADRWRDEFTAMGKALGGGSGWVMLVFQPREGTLVNQWSADHTHALAGGIPILALDMYEHAYHMDFGAAAGAYVDAFMDNIHWAHVHKRYQQAVEATSGALAATINDLQGAQLFDVRRAGVFEKADSIIPNATWRDPQTVGDWAATVAKDDPVVVYCVYGHEVSRATAMRLRAAGVNARFLSGGFDAWKTAGKPVQSKATTPPGA